MNGREPDQEGVPSVDEVVDLLGQVFRSGQRNAILAWALCSILAGVFVESLLDGDELWIVFVAAVALIVFLPPLVHRNWRIMVPWELLLLALFPVLTRGLVGGRVGVFATYLAIAGLALIVTVELHAFTALHVTHWFAIAIVTMTTIASVAAWTVLRWTFDRLLGTAYLTTNEALMIEWLWVTLAGIVAGILFDAYFRHRDRLLRRAILSEER